MSYSGKHPERRKLTKKFDDPNLREVAKILPLEKAVIDYLKTRVGSEEALACLDNYFALQGRNVIRCPTLTIIHT